jgi:hypothetical protein
MKGVRGTCWQTFCRRCTASRHSDPFTSEGALK